MCEIDTISHFHDYINKCRCCLTQFTEKEARIMLNESHREIYRSVIKVELIINSSLSSWICEICNKKLRNVSDVVQELGRVQKMVNELFTDGNDNIIKEEIISYDVIEQTDDVFYDEIKIEEEQIMSQDMILNSETLKASTRECSVRIKRLELKDLPDEHESTPVIELTDCLLHLERQNDVTNEVKIIKNPKQNSKEIPGQIIKNTEKSCSCDICGKKCYSTVVMKGHMRLAHLRINCLEKKCKSKFIGLESAKDHYQRCHNSDPAV